MSEQNPSEETVSSLSQALTQFIDYVGQSLRAHEVQLRSQQEQVNETRQLVNETRQLTRQLVEAQIETFRRFDEMQSEIRGLQTENRRILEEFIDRREPPEEPEN